VRSPNSEDSISSQNKPNKKIVLNESVSKEKMGSNSSMNTFFKFTPLFLGAGFLGKV